MADDWFKLNMDIFGNRKIKYLRRLPNGDSIVLFWIALLAEARRCNCDGKVFLTENIQYTTDMLAEEFNFSESIVQSALEAFGRLEMVNWDDGCLTISGWEDHQNAEGLAKIRESKRLAQARWRAKQKESPESTVDSTVDSTRYLVDDAEEDIEKEKDIELDIKKESVTCKQVVDLFHSICKSFSVVRSLTDARKKAIKARLNTYSLEDFRTVFENAEASAFLKGSNDRNWTATFDWLIKDANMAKVLEGNYADKPKQWKRDERVIYGSGELGQAELDAIKQLMGTEPEETVDNSPELAAEVEQVQQRLKEKYGKKDAG